MGGIYEWRMLSMKDILYPSSIRNFSRLAKISHKTKSLSLAACALSAAAVLTHTSTVMATLVTSSSNWGGYADVSSSSSQTFTNVSGDWTVPTVSTSSSGYSSFWVGLDGFSSSTVEQIGIEADSAYGRTDYYAWYEMYPNNSFEIPLTIKPGNAISADVSYIGSNKYDLSINDITTGKSYNITKTMSGGQRSSAEWIAEAPSDYFGVLPLANFGSDTFTVASATLNGVTGSISAFSNYDIDLETPTLDATPTALSSNGTSFSISTSAVTPILTRGRGGRGGWNWWSGDDPTAVPEPSSLTLIGSVAGMLLLGRKRRKVLEPLTK